MVLRILTTLGSATNAIFGLVSLLVSFSQVQAEEGLHQFPITVGDSIRIEVYDEPDLNVSTRVSQSRKVKMPLIGELEVVGKAPSTLAEEIENKLFDGYLVNLVVRVEIVEYKPFYVRGAVRSPGLFRFEIDLNVDRAIAMAGGLTDRASGSSWHVIRGADKSKLKALKETLVLPGDIITIEESLF